MKLHLSWTDFCSFLIISQIFYCCCSEKVVSGASDKAIRFNYELAVPDPGTRRMISKLLYLPPETRALRMDSGEGSEGGKEILEGVIGFLEKLVKPIADAIDQYLRHNWEDRIAALNATLNDRAKDKDSAEKKLEKAERALEATKKMVEMKQACRKKCEAWCSAMECHAPNCPEIPSDINRCARLPLCLPAWRCTLDIAQDQKLNETKIHHPKASNRLHTARNKMTMKDEKKKKRTRLHSERNGRTKRSQGEKDGKFPGTKKCFKVLRLLKVSDQALNDFKRKVEEYAGRVEKHGQKERIEIMCKLLKSYNETSLKSPCDRNSFKDIIDGIPALFYHTNLEAVDKLMQKSTEFEKYGFKRAHCLPCESTCPHLLDLECSYICPNRPGCAVYKCNCF